MLRIPTHGGITIIGVTTAGSVDHRLGDSEKATKPHGTSVSPHVKGFRQCSLRDNMRVPRVHLSTNNGPTGNPAGFGMNSPRRMTSVRDLLATSVEQIDGSYAVFAMTP